MLRVVNGPTERPGWTAALRQLADRPDWLLAALRPERVLEALRRHIPEAAAGELQLIDCDAKQLMLKNTSGHWRGVYTLTAQSEQDDEPKTYSIRVALTAPNMPSPDTTQTEQQPFGADEWRCYLPELRLECELEPPEQALPILPQLIDPEESRALLEQSIRAGSPAYRELRMQTCQPTVLNYKPGSRCTIRYDMEYAAADAGKGWPTTAIAKVYRAQKGEQAYAGMIALWESPLSASKVVRIAEPLAYIPEHKLLVQATLGEEQTLEEFLRTTLQSGDAVAQRRLESFVRAAAAGLAELHLSGAQSGERLTWEERITTIPEAIERIAPIAPEVAQAVQPLFERLTKLAAATPADPLVPSHGSFDSDQVLIAQERIGFIDFDSFCMAEPAVDVGHFRAAIMDSGMKLIDDATLHDPVARKAYLDRLNDLGALFLAEYEARAPISRQRLAIWEAWDYLRDSLHLWTKPKLRGADAVVSILEYHLQRTEVLD
ncbi:MAG TPA: phosphotransferase [Roseiflexaceae bacterium]|nr:phosphotransferase [Roseiflexaceae bacterium]